MICLAILSMKRQPFTSYWHKAIYDVTKGTDNFFGYLFPGEWRWVPFYHLLGYIIMLISDNRHVNDRHKPLSQSDQSCQRELESSLALGYSKAPAWLQPSVHTWVYTWACTLCWCWSPLVLLGSSCRSDPWCSWTSRSGWLVSLEALGQKGETRQSERTEGAENERAENEREREKCQVTLSAIFPLGITCTDHPAVAFLKNWLGSSWFALCACVRACVDPCQHSSSLRTQGPQHQCGTMIRICVCVCSPLCSFHYEKRLLTTLRG